jgi:hypothetical protein
MNKLPEMCNTCKQFMVAQICRDYGVSLSYEEGPYHPWVKDEQGNYTKKIEYFIKPDFSKWDGKTGINGDNYK